MRNILIGMILVTMTACTSAAKAPTAAPRPTTPVALEDLTVLVKVDCGEAGKGWGSGTVLNGNKVLTAAHVINEPGCTITVKRENEDEYYASVLNKDEKADMAVLLVDHDYGVSLTIGVSKRKQHVTCLGYPVQPTSESIPYLSVSYGTILTVDVPDGDGILVNRTSAAILFGSSGGGCFDDDSNLVGVVDSLITKYQDYKFLLRSEDISHYLTTNNLM